VDHVDVDIAVLHPQDLLKEGVDMHCHPKIIDQLGETAEVVRRAITPEAEPAEREAGRCGETAAMRSWARPGW
jgi:hypothetical protein